MIRVFTLHYLRQFWVRISSSLWFVPLGMVFCAISLAMILIAADIAIGSDWIAHNSMLFGVGASGARGMLTAIAGSMMTVASLTFSLTISTLATASSQYTSRLIRNFMRDRLNQFVLGYFVGLFAYCLIVLRTIRSGDMASYVPPLAVMGGLLFALFSIGVLIFFIHHIAESIQIGNILRSVTRETLRAIDTVFPDTVGVSKTRAGCTPGRDFDDFCDNDCANAHAGCTWYRITACRFGYVQSLDEKALLDLADKNDAKIRISADIGSFVTPEGILCEIALSDLPSDELISELREAFDQGTARTIEQDAAFGIRQIVDIALRALSSGINDTTTGVMCVDHLAAVLELLAARSIPDRLRSPDGTIRIIASDRTFDVLAGLCLNQIRQSASGNAAVMQALLRAIGAAERQTSDRARRRFLSHHTSLIAALARDSVACSDDAAPVLVKANILISRLNAARNHPE